MKWGPLCRLRSSCVQLSLGRWPPARTLRVSFPNGRLHGVQLHTKAAGLFLNLVKLTYQDLFEIPHALMHYHHARNKDNLKHFSFPKPFCGQELLWKEQMREHEVQWLRGLRCYPHCSLESARHSESQSIKPQLSSQKCFRF